VATKTGDIGANLGFSNENGADNSKHVSMGFDVGYNFTSHLALTGEYEYMPEGTVSSSGVSVTTDTQLLGVAPRFTLINYKNVSPYAVGGFGYAYSRASAATSSISVSANVNGFYAGAGGGVSIFGGRHWGIRPEIRWERQEYYSDGQSDGKNFARGTISIFYQGGGNRYRK
jgi:hypothetical protein